MSELLLLVAGLFLPLFPLSMVFNELFDRIGKSKLRMLLLLVWPQIGLAIAYSTGIEIPSWIIGWAILTAVLYGFRALVLREVSLWVSFIATSTWAILWLVIDGSSEFSQLVFYALGFSVPLALLVLLSCELERRFGAAYTGLYNGLAQTLPRLSGVLVIVVLAIIATPLFPAFTVMMAAILSSSATSLIMAIAVAIVWLLWGWAGTRFLQGLIIGPVHEEPISDLSSGTAWFYALVLGVLGIYGISMIGGLS